MMSDGFNAFPLALFRKSNLITNTRISKCFTFKFIEFNLLKLTSASSVALANLTLQHHLYTCYQCARFYLNS